LTINLGVAKHAHMPPLDDSDPENAICQLFTSDKGSLLARDIKRIRIYKVTADARGREQRTVFKLPKDPETDEPWQPNFYEDDESVLADWLEPGKYYIEAVGLNGQVLNFGHNVVVDGEGEDEEGDEEYEDGDEGPEPAAARGAAASMFAAPAALPAHDGGAPVTVISDPAGKMIGMAVQGLPPDKQAEFALGFKALEDAKADARRREEALEREREEVRKAREAQTTQSPFAMLKDAMEIFAPMRAQQQQAANPTREHHLEEQVSWYRQQLDAKGREIEDLRRAARDEVARVEDTWRERLSRVETGLQDRVSKLDKEIDELRRENVKLLKEKMEAEAEAASAAASADAGGGGAAAGGGEGGNVFGLMQQLADIAPHIPALLAQLKGAGGGAEIPPAAA
jgi:hypothetical protein